MTTTNPTVTELASASDYFERQTTLYSDLRKARCRAAEALAVAELLRREMKKREGHLRKAVDVHGPALEAMTAASGALHDTCELHEEAVRLAAIAVDVAHAAKHAFADFPAHGVMTERQAA